MKISIIRRRDAINRVSTEIKYMKFKIPKLKLNFNKKYILGFMVVFVLIGGSALMYQIFTTKGANYSFSQTSWDGGASTTAMANHNDDQENWEYYYSKDDGVSTSTSGQLTLSAQTASTTDTETADFNNAESTSNVYVADGTVYLSKPDGASCANADECLGEYCIDSACLSCAGVYYDNHCLYLGIATESCTTVCSSHGGSAGIYWDNSSCSGIKQFLGCAGCAASNSAQVPSRWDSNGYCLYRTSDDGWDVDASVPSARRLCACIR